MAKRYYICDIIGDGQDVDPTPTTGPFRPAVADLGVSWSGAIPTGDDGRPTSTWALVIVATQDHARVRQAAGVDPLPDFPLDGKVSAINTGTRTALKAVLARRGVPTSLVDNTDGYRELIRAVGQRLEAAFDENKFDVAE